MKILHVSTFDVGGAAIAAARLHQGLLKQGVATNFMSLFSSKEIPNSFQHQYTYKERTLENLRLRLGLSRCKRKADLLRNLMGSFQIEMGDLPLSNFDITEQEVYRNADIINLHWVSNYLDYKSFFRKNKKPVVWTLHDMNPFLGIFHYEGDEVRNRERLEKVDKIAREIKENAFSKSNLNIVCPSKWLLGKSESSKFFGAFKHVHIPYGLDTDEFKPYSNLEAREALGLPADKKIILFVSQSVNNLRKGFDLLIDAIEELSLEEIKLVAVGDRTQTSLPSVIYLGAIHDNHQLALAYSAADVFVLPSREDNLPNTMLEALNCGLPVITFPVGGMRDVIKNGVNGYLCSEVTGKSLAETIRLWYKNPDVFNRKQIRRQAVDMFSEKNQAEKYIELYQNVLANA